MFCGFAEIRWHAMMIYSRFKTPSPGNVLSIKLPDVCLPCANRKKIRSCASSDAGVKTSRSQARGGLFHEKRLQIFLRPLRLVQKCTYSILPTQECEEFH